MKKYISLFLCLVLILFVFAFPVNANDNNISTEQMKDFLMHNGLPSFYVFSMSDVEIEDLYNDIESGKCEIIIKKESITMDPQENMINTYGLIDEDNFDLIVGSITLYGDNNRIDEVRGIVTWQWRDGHPAGRRDDLVHISWEPSCFTFTTTDFLSVDHYTKHLGEYVVYNEATSPAEATTCDMVVYTDVFTGLGVDRGGGCIFTLIPAKPMYKGKDSSTPIVATYYHNKSLVPFVNGFTYSDTGSGLQINFQDVLTDTSASSYAFRYS